MTDRRFGLILQCAGAADVVGAVNLVREHNLLASVRGDAHSVAGLGVHDDAVMIDLSRMRGVHVDPDRRVARVQGGASLGDLDRESQLFGLATPGGVDGSDELVRATHGDNLRRLAEIKAAYDPGEPLPLEPEHCARSRCDEPLTASAGTQCAEQSGRCASIL